MEQRLKIYDSRWKKCGFTLIEMMVAVVVMGLLIGGGVAAYSRFDQKQRVVQAGKDVATFLRSAQKRTASGEKLDGCASLDGYQIGVTTGGTQGVMTAICDEGTVQLAAGTVTLPSGVQFVTTTTVLFKVLSRGVTGAGSIDISDLSGTYTFRLTVTETGAIVEAGIQ